MADLIRHTGENFFATSQLRIIEQYPKTRGRTFVSLLDRSAASPLLRDGFDRLGCDSPIARPADLMSEAIGVSRSGFHAWRHRFGVARTDRWGDEDLEHGLV